MRQRQKYRRLTSLHSSDHELFPIGQEKSAARGMLKGDGLSTYERNRSWERCSVTAVHPKTHTCDVYTERGKLLTGCAWPGKPIITSPPNVGDVLLCHFQSGAAVLLHTAPAVSLPVTVNSSLSHAPGAADTTKVQIADPAQPNFAGKGPTDVLPGDMVVSSSSGNYVGALRQGINTMKSSEFAQIQTHEENELVRMIGRVVQLFSGAGSLVMDNDNGKTSLVFQIGADEGAESNPLQENFRVRYSAGQKGNLSDFRITDGKGSVVYSMQIFPDGRSNTEGLSEAKFYGEDRLITARDQTFTGRNMALRTEQEIQLRAGSKLRLRSLGRVSMTSINNMSFFSGKNMSLTSGDTMSIKANGPLIPIPGNEAFKVVASNGDIVLDAGNPLSGDLQTARSSMLFDTQTGDFRFTSFLGGLSVDSLGQVKIGGPPLSVHPAPVAPSVHGAVLHDRLMTAVSALALDLAVHTHTDPVSGTTGPPAAPPVTPATLTAFGASRSIFVSFGG